MNGMSDKTPLYEQLDVASYIVTVRGQKVILDADLARIYGVTTKALNQAVKRNASRFPEDFAFQLTPDEFAGLRSQFATTCDRRRLTSPPRAFTEHGAIMAANVLSSPQAVEMGVFVVRAPIWSAAASGIPRDAAFRVRAGKRCRTSFVTALQNTDAPRSMCA